MHYLQSLGAAAVGVACAKAAVGAVVGGRAPAVCLIAVHVLLDFGVGVHAGAEDGGAMHVVAHYDGLVE